MLLKLMRNSEVTKGKNNEYTQAVLSLSVSQLSREGIQQERLRENVQRGTEVLKMVAVADVKRV